MTPKDADDRKVFSLCEDNRDEKKHDWLKPHEDGETDEAQRLLAHWPVEDVRQWERVEIITQLLRVLGEDHIFSTGRISMPSAGMWYFHMSGKSSVFGTVGAPSPGWAQPHRCQETLMTQRGNQTTKPDHTRKPTFWDSARAQWDSAGTRRDSPGSRPYTPVKPDHHQSTTRSTFENRPAGNPLGFSRDPPANGCDPPQNTGQERSTNQKLTGWETWHQTFDDSDRC